MLGLTDKGYAPGGLIAIKVGRNKLVAFDHQVGDAVALDVIHGVAPGVAHLGSGCLDGFRGYGLPAAW